MRVSVQLSDLHRDILYIYIFIYVYILQLYTHTYKDLSFKQNKDKSTVRKISKGFPKETAQKRTTSQWVHESENVYL